ncbi:MAG: PEP-CTERM sorting domain-containing protein [Bryobacterales bacterium]|nr:PEP-CTERM sorting domain-containing protein [Bryobacterales bacterium]
MSERKWFVPVAALFFGVAMWQPGFASVIQPTPELPPTGGGFFLGEICVSNLLGAQGACVSGANLSNFTGRVSTITAAGQEVDTQAEFQAQLYAFQNGVKGGFLGSLLLTGPVGFLYAGRQSASESGTYATTFTELMLTGAFNGIPVAVKGDLTKSKGTTTISEYAGAYRIDSFFDVFVELSVNNGPFVPGPGRPFTLRPVPEPGSLVMAALGFAALGLAGRRGRRA